MVSKLFRLIHKIKNRILRQISRVAYEGQNVNFTGTISYFDAKDNLHTNSIKQDGIEDATVVLIVSNIINVYYISNHNCSDAIDLLLIWIHIYR